MMGEVLEDGELVQLAEGGKRGLGNIRYVSSTHQAPEEHTSGGEGAEFHLKLELKLIADAGFAGFPNAGKSTLLSTISAAQPKVADYPFTTLEPQLGVVDVSEQTGEWGKSFVAADIPGLIEGASEGKGLGHEFLRHLERTKVIVFVIDAFPFDETTPVDAFNKLKSELANYGSELAEKKFLVLLTKLDLAPPEFDWSSITAPFNECGIDCLKISSLSRTGLGDAKLKIWQVVEKERLLIKKEDAVVPLTSVQDRSEEFELLTDRFDEDLGL
jgi:GTP-binding protein